MYINKLILIVLFLVTRSSVTLFAEDTIQDDTVNVHHAELLPVIDGLGDDECWNKAAWQSIDQVWINYGEILDSSDFSGRFKILWSAESNLLYYLIEVTDDTFIDGWPDVPGDYFAFDIIEIFIDQDKSGGLHVFDGTGNTGEQWGTNAENAFSYHINIDLPTEGEYSTECVVNDIAGTDWGTLWNPDYSSHFPEIALRENNGKYYWEFSMIIYNDTYYHPLPDYSRVQLTAGDIMGMSVAYCDNDGIEESPKTRDNFIGSVWVPEEEYNDHWMDADGYGTIKLVSDITNVQSQLYPAQFSLKDNYPNPFNPSTVIEFEIPEQGFVSLNIYDILGRKVSSLIKGNMSRGLHRIKWDGKNSDRQFVAAGIYFYKIEYSDFSITKKMTLIK